MADSCKKLGDALAHRGPDGSGHFTSGNTALAHKRLAVIDPQGGAQPFVSSQGNALIFNGMIYNYRALMSELPDAQFSSKCDAEVPLHLYEKHGPDFLQKLRGMYALALYDKKRDELILARDPYGIKPLYYVQTDDLFAFASEPQAFFKAGILEPILCRESAVELMQLKFITSAKTAFENVFRVLPGEMLIVKNGRIRKRHRIDPFETSAVSEQKQSQALEQLDALLCDTVKLYCQSDVPYGVFLSGGVDSCSIVAAMAASGITDFPCYTATFPDSALQSEAETARAVAKQAGARHIELPIHAGDFWEVLPDVIAHLDDPSLDPAMPANYLLSRRAHEDVKVVLGGDGGDEIFAGYRRYERASLPKFIPKYPLRRRGQFDGTNLTKFAGDDWRAGFAKSELAAKTKTKTLLQALQATDGADFLPHFHLMKLDRCLMAFGIEGRVPLLDQKLAGFGFNLPDKLKLRRRTGKLLLRQWLDNTLPIAQAFSRKRGFSTPVNEWIHARAPALRHFVCDQPGVRELFEIDKVNDLFVQSDHPSKKLRWAILFFAMWHNTHILGEKPRI